MKINTVGLLFLFVSSLAQLSWARVDYPFSADWEGARLILIKPIEIPASSREISLLMHRTAHGIWKLESYSSAREIPEENRVGFKEVNCVLSPERTFLRSRTLAEHSVLKVESVFVDSQWEGPYGTYYHSVTFNLTNEGDAYEMVCRRAFYLIDNRLVTMDLGRGVPRNDNWFEDYVNRDAPFEKTIHAMPAEQEVIEFIEQFASFLPGPSSWKKTSKGGGAAASVQR